MLRNPLAFIVLAAALAACAVAPPPLGTPAWHGWVEQRTGVVDAEGHGPDRESAEWCHAVHRKTFGADAGEPACDGAWERSVDRALRGEPPVSG